MADTKKKIKALIFGADEFSMAIKSIFEWFKFAGYEVEFKNIRGSFRVTENVNRLINFNPDIIIYDVYPHLVLEHETFCSVLPKDWQNRVLLGWALRAGYPDCFASFSKRLNFRDDPSEMCAKIADVLNVTNPHPECHHE